MMIGERNHSNPTVHVPPWALIDNPIVDTSYSFPAGGISLNLNSNAEEYSPFLGGDALTALQRYLPSNDVDVDSDESDVPVDAYSCDHFRMFEFKVRKCARGRSHDWTECPYAHPGEKARRRDPRKYHYSGTACPEFRKGSLLNLLAQKGLAFMSSQESESVSPPSESPPVSPMANSMSPSLGSHSINEMVASLRQLQLNKVKSMPSSWGLQIGGSGFGSPRLSISRPGFCSLPSTPTRALTRPGIGYSDVWDRACCEEEPVMERVESGRDLRAKMFEKLSKENPLDRVDPTPSSQGPDVGWISELVK
ncbi:hypothetical protein F0562_009630 [Nyssa sinensis]|uniref:AtC3H23-like CCCH zinc finger domain-containing protein n=1 Tax=Nyssa sinensis TaxID=561372 RepID=A0A5J5A1L0_9ASTE|nr:hypothetical protein F0562_009630 [Nyssa sinensis]